MSDHIDALYSERGKLRARITELESWYLRCAQAIGVVYEGDGFNTQPGPIDAVETAIEAVVRNSTAAYERVAELERERAKHEAFAADVHDVLNATRKERDAEKARADAAEARLKRVEAIAAGNPHAITKFALEAALRCEGGEHG